MRNQDVTVKAPGQSMASVEAFLKKKNKKASEFFECKLSNLFVIRYVGSIICLLSSVVIENVTSFNNICMALSVIAVITGSKAIWEYMRNVKED